MDRSADLADSDDSWARFDSGPPISLPGDHHHAAASQSAGSAPSSNSKPKPRGFYYDDDSSDDDDDTQLRDKREGSDVFVPSPTKEDGEVGRCQESAKAYHLDGPVGSSSGEASSAGFSGPHSDEEDEWRHLGGPRSAATLNDLVAITALAGTEDAESDEGEEEGHVSDHGHCKYAASGGSEVTFL